MPQGFSKTLPATGAGISSSELRTLFNALASMNEGASEPADLQRGLLWLDVSDTANWKLKMRIENDAPNPDRFVTLFENVNNLVSGATTPGGSSQVEFDQAVAASTWIIAHNLGRQFPDVSVINTSVTPPENIDPSAYTVKYVDANNLEIEFPGTTTGKAIIR